MPYNYPNLNANKALIWRIVHRDNFPWIMANGVHCGNSAMRSPRWVTIGNSELIEKRAAHPVPISPYGMLNDYVPFYFTPFSPMLSLILAGRGVPVRTKEEIVILVSSVHHLRNRGVPVIFTDMHAYYQWATFHADVARLDRIDWRILQARDFKRDPDDPKKFERYQAEALVHQHLAVADLLGVMCYTEEVKQQLDETIQVRGSGLQTYVRREWYF